MEGVPNPYHKRVSVVITVDKKKLNLQIGYLLMK